MVSPPTRSAGALLRRHVRAADRITLELDAHLHRTVDAAIARPFEHALAQAPHGADDGENQQELEDRRSMALVVAAVDGS